MATETNNKDPRDQQQWDQALAVGNLVAAATAFRKATDDYIAVVSPENQRKYAQATADLKRVAARFNFETGEQVRS